MTYHAYSDGACKGNPGPGGWGSIVIAPGGQRQEMRGGELNTTNNKMELTGAIEALKATPPGATVILTTDSQYVIKGITEWMFGWKKRGWEASTGGPVKNQELWKELDKEVAQRKVKWEWVKGHAGHPENERCDDLANLGIGDLPGGAAILAAANAAKPAKKKPVARKAGTVNGLLKPTVQVEVKPDSGPVLGDSDMVFEL